VRRRELIGLGAAAAALGLARPAWAAGAPKPPRRGGALKHIGLDAQTFDVQAAGAAEAQVMMSSLVRRGLFRAAPPRARGAADPGPVPDLARRADVSADGRTYVLALRRGIRWEDRAPLHGRELTAADVRHTMERALKRSPRAGLLGPVQAIDAVDPHTVRVRLAEPFAPFLANLADPSLGILAPEIEQALGDLRSAASLVGCGPFVLERYDPGVKAVFARNPGYHRMGLPYLDRVEWIFVRDQATQLSLFRAGQVDLAAPDGRIGRGEAAALPSSRAHQLRYWEPATVRSLALRVDRPPFSDVRVRRALSLAINRRSWAAQLFDGEASQGQGPLPAAMREWLVPAPDLGDGARYLAHDPEQARRLLAVAGFARGLTVACAQPGAHDPEPAAELDLLAASFRLVGVELQLAAPGTPEDASWGPWPVHAEVGAHLEGAFRSGHPENRSRVADPALDAMLDAQRRARSRAARHRIIADIQRHVAERVYYIYPPTPRSLAAWTSRVHGYAPTDSLDRGAQLESVWLDAD